MQSATSWGLESCNEPRRLHKGDMCSCKIKFQLQWEHGWPEAQLSRFLKRHFLNSSLILPHASRHWHIFMSARSSPRAGSAVSATLRLCASFARFAPSCRGGAGTVDTSADTRHFYGHIKHWEEIAPQIFLISMEWNALHMQFTLYVRTVVAAYKLLSCRAHLVLILLKGFSSAAVIIEQNPPQKLIQCNLMSESCCYLFFVREQRFTTLLTWKFLYAWFKFTVMGLSQHADCYLSCLWCSATCIILKRLTGEGAVCLLIMSSMRCPLAAKKPIWMTFLIQESI